MRALIFLLAAAIAGPCATDPLRADPLDDVTAEVVLFGEVHDNPAHHAQQAAGVAQLRPAALVFEMLTPDQARAAEGPARDDAAALAEALGWEGSGWPEFAMYHPIFAAAPEAQLFGAGVPRDQTRAAMEAGVPRSFGAEAELYGLTEPLEAGELAKRLELQMEAHCGALPRDMLPAMVDLQRLRDAVLAQTTLAALDATGGPVVVITGNGHARRDWGVPRALARVAPGVSVFVVGQGEDGQVPDGGFDLVLDAPGVVRDDPCAVFATGD